jgi:serine/threonine protein kinase/Flp pilus assembly protein TadD
LAIKCPKCHADNIDTARYCSNCATSLTQTGEPGVSVTRTIETSTDELVRGVLFAGRYEIIEELGTGGMGRVYRAHDTKLNEEVALKLIKPEIAAERRAVERFRNELKVTRKITHPNVCRVHDLGEEGKTLYITMEYVKGEDLKSVIHRMVVLTAGKAVSIARQVAEGLGAAHKLGIVHRDLKPGNIMIDKDGQAKIMDFGISRSLAGGGTTAEGAIIGTPEYMSPEQVEGKQADQRSDIYALGIILFEMVTGRLPFEGETPFSIANKQKSEPPPDPRKLNPQIPAELDRVILRSLEKAKEKRYQTTGEFLADLAGVEAALPTGERTSAKPRPKTSREITVKFTPRKALIPALAMIVLAVAAFIFIKIFSKGGQHNAPKIENSLAIISFANQTGDKSYDYLQTAIPNLLITNLENAGQFYVVTWERLHDLLKQLGKKDVEVIDGQLGFELCRREGVKALVLGSYIKAGNVFATDVKVLDVETKKSLKSVSTRGDGIESILRTQIDDLSREILLGMGLAREKIEEAQLKVIDVTTTSMEAYNYLLEGEKLTAKLYYGDARKSYEKAISLDPTFAAGYLDLAYACGGLGDAKAMVEAIEKAKALSQKATERERLWIEASYASLIEHDPDKEFRIVQQIAEKYPRDKEVYFWLGGYYGDQNPTKAIDAYARALDLDPNDGMALNSMAMAYLILKNYDKAIECMKKYAAVSPGDANPPDSLAYVLYCAGRLDEAIANFKKALAIKPDFLMSLGSMLYVYALKEDYQEAMKLTDQYIGMAQSPYEESGSYLLKGFLNCWLGSLERSLASLAEAAQIAEASGREARKAYIEYIKAWIYLDRGELEKSQKCNESWIDVQIKLSPFLEQFYLCRHSFLRGSIELAEGKIDQPKTRLAEMKAVFPRLPPSISAYNKKIMEDWCGVLEAEISLSEKLPDKAISILEKARPLESPGLQFEDQLIQYNMPFLRDTLARAYLQRGDLDKAIDEYKRLTTFDPKSENRRLVNPKYHYRLALLYEKKGQKSKASREYRRFLDLWKDADPGLPEVADAKKRLAAL